MEMDVIPNMLSYYNRHSCQFIAEYIYKRHIIAETGIEMVKYDPCQLV